MKINELYVLDLAASAYYNLHKMLKETKLLENNNDYQQYSTFIDKEKSYLPNLIPTHTYYPIYLNSVPVGQYILGEYTPDSLTYKTSSDRAEIFENNNGKEVRFPQDKYMSDGRIDLLPFMSNANRAQFLSVLRLTFAGWAITINSRYI